MCLRNASSLARKTLSQCRCVCTFYSIFSLIFYNFTKSSLNGVNRWNGEGVELELESERESRKCLCVFHSTLFLIPTLQFEGEDIPSAFAFGSCVIVGRVSTHFFPPTLLFSPRFRPLADCRKKTRGEGKTVCSRSLFRRRKRRKNKENFYFIFYSSPRNSKTQKGWNLWVVESSEKFFLHKTR